MKTPYLDKEIEYLESIKKAGEISFYSSKKLEEYKEAKKQLSLCSVSNSKADERERAYQKFFYDHPNFRGKSIRYRGEYIFHKDEAYDCIDYYLKTGIEP